MAGYVRNDTSNNIADGNIINAADLDGEFNALVAAFVNTTGHTHDGTAAEGAPITKIGPTQDVVASATELTPKTTNTVDLGNNSLKFKDIYAAGTAYVDTLDLTNALSVADGGTGATTLTGVVRGNGTSAFTTGNVSLSSEVTGTLPVANGGTGAATLTGVVRGNGTSAFTTGSVSLSSEVTGTLPVANGGTGATTLTGVVRGNGTSAFTTGSVSLTTEVTGTLPVANGGTGAATFTTNNVLLGNGTSAFQVVAPGTSGNVLTSDGTTWQSSPAAGALPSQTGNAGKFLSTDGTNPSWEVALAAQSLYIFSSAAVSVDGVSSGEDLIPPSVLYSTGLAGNINQILFANSLYIAVGSSVQAAVATSSDGETWTLRTMPASAGFIIGQDGNNLMALAGTNVATSTDSITWTLATALPLAATGPYPAALSGTWLAVRSATNYLSTDFGVTWSAAETLPASVFSASSMTGGMFVVNGYFWYIASTGTTAYYSTTGLTGSWTSVALPVTINRVWRQNNTIYFASAATNAQVYRVDDETTFTAITNIVTTDSFTRVIPVLGIWASFSPTFGSAATYHNGQAVLRRSSQSVTFQSYESGGVSLVPLAGNSIAKYTGTNGPTAIFTV